MSQTGTLAGDSWEANFWQRRQDAYYAQLRQQRKQQAIADLRTAQEAYAASMNPPRRAAYAYDSGSRGDFDQRFPQVSRIRVQG